MPSIEIDIARPVWDRVYIVAPLILIGTLEADGTPDLAPKHMAMPLSFDNWFGFVCTERHATLRNALRTGVFTVSYPHPDAIVPIAMAAGPRTPDGAKPSLAAIPTEPARVVEGVVLREHALALECELDRTVGGLGDNTLVIGRIVAARAPEALLRRDERDDNELVHAHPLLAFLYPDRFASIDQTNQLPYHTGFER